MRSSSVELLIGKMTHTKPGRATNTESNLICFDEMQLEGSSYCSKTISSHP